ncbi:MAG: DNA polymerase sliding clamp [Candidatus Aenigmarchaeota archaeon]|nr:DNA polymerase sliding clamp [Candidatus Aenigmarchaeota archaeon]MDW8148987.1 DNA polymerase sliding clamp [Candidatus Aenigmarchaeota archaeon]
MKLVLNDSDLLKIPMKTISQIIDEGIFTINKDSFQFASTDRAMICMIELKLLSTAFEEYVVDKEYSIGLNLENFADVLARATKKDKLTLEVKEGKLIVTLEGTGKRRFALPILDIKKEDLPDVSNLEFTAKVTMNTNLLSEAIRDVELVGESILFKANENGFFIEGGSEMSTTTTEVLKDSPDLIELEVKTPSKARYPLDYISKVIALKELSNDITIEFANDFPCKISSKILDKIYFSMIIAPRVE